MTIFERIKKLRLEKGWTLEELGQAAGLSKQTMWKYESGSRPNIKADKIARIAVALGVSPVYLMFGDEYPNTNGLAMLGQHISDRPAPLETRRVPVLGSTAAGEPIPAERVYDEYVEVPADGRRFDAAVRVEGDSMSPLFAVGDLALIRYQPDLEDGEIGVVCIGDTVTLKRIYHVNGGIMLHSENPRYKPIMVTGDEGDNVHLTGKVVGHVHWFEA